MPHVAAAWQEVSPGVFGRPEHWKEDARWRTPSERAAAIEIQNLREARETAIAKFDQFEDDAQQRLQLSTDEADARERRLLTTKGSALVEAVEETLATLGFEVRDMDEVHPDRDKREDLRVTHPSDPAWEAIIEVKGYARSGAAVGDLSKLIRHKGRYQNAEKREPSACWYVVNQFYEQDPAMRQPLLASNPAEVEDFVVEDRGALIDTAQLFELVVSVQSGESSPEDVAARLIALRGHL